MILPSLLLALACTGGGLGNSSDGAEITLVDSDGDTIIDIHEGIWVDADSEDGETQGSEADTDQDGEPDHLDLDSDNDGISLSLIHI